MYWCCPPLLPERCSSELELVFLNLWASSFAADALEDCDSEILVWLLPETWLLIPETLDTRTPGAVCRLEDDTDGTAGGIRL